jgi:coenzyme F420-0:L-glutamate ligase/coenzyme F420-1:gamma-L-glutamate ligase
MLIKIIPIMISSDIKKGDDLGAIIADAAKRNSQRILDGDIIVIAQKIVSKAEGRIVDLRTIRPGRMANKLAREQGKDPRVTEVILRESASIVKAKSGIIISETKHGFVCANAGVDQSNAEGKESAILLPTEPDRSARRLSDSIERKTGAKIAVIIADTFGRAFRIGQTNTAIGVAGIKPIKSYIGKRDMYGRKLQVTEIAVADEIASAAELVMGKSERVPVAIVRGYGFEKASGATVRELIRPKKSDLFR